MSGLAIPAKRWDGPYSASEFQPQLPAPFTAALAGCADLRAAGQRISAALAAARLPSWTGDAGTAYRHFLAQLDANLDTVDAVLRKAALAVQAGAAAVAAQDGPAQEVADLANDAQRKRHENNTDSVLDSIGDFLTGDDMAVELQMNVALDAGAHVVGRVRDALQQLADDLDGPDAALSALRLPAPPTTPDPALALVFYGVADAEAKLGHDAAALDALKTVQLDLTFGGSQAAVDRLRSLTPAELAWVLEHLTQDEAAQLLGGLDPVKDRAVYEFLATHAPLDVLNRFADVDPHHVWQPFYNDGNTGLYYDTPGAPSGGPSADPDDLNQGGLGDCHLLASLAAVETADPGFLNDHITANANGTYTVQLFDKDGKPFAVTVTPDVPFRNGGPAYTHGDGSGDLTAYQIYEKAIAQSRDRIDLNGDLGYGNTDGGWPEKDMPFITGNDAIAIGAGDVTGDLITTNVDNGVAMTVTTKGDDSGSWYTEDDNYLVAGHAYYVTGIDNSVDPPIVTLTNPWDDDWPGTGTVKIPLPDLQAQTSGLQYTNP